MRKRESNNGKPEKKDEKDKSKDGHEAVDKKDKDAKKDVEEKGTESGELYATVFLRTCTSVYYQKKKNINQDNQNFFFVNTTVKKIDDKAEGATDEKKLDASEKKDDATKDADTRSTKSTSKKPESERGKRDDKRIRAWDHHRSHSRSRSRERRRRDDVLTFAKIRVRYFCVARS